MSVIRINVIQFHRAKRENTVLSVIVHAMEIKVYLLTYLLTYVSESPGGIFAVTTHLGPRFSCFFAYFVYIAHFTKFTGGSSLLMEKSKVEESPW